MGFDVWPIRTICYFAIFWGACVLALVNPIWGVVNYLMVYQMNPVDTWWGKPIAQLGVRYSLYAVAFTGLGMLLSHRRVPQVRPFLSIWELGLLVLLGAAAVNYNVDFGLGQPSKYAFEKLWKMFVFVFILTRLATNRANLRVVIWALVAGSLYLGYDAYTSPEWAFQHGRLNTVGGPDFSTTSGFAAHLSAMLPIIGLAFLTVEKWRWKAVAALAGGLVVNAIVLCRTRSAFIGLTIGTLAAFLFAPRAKRYRIHALLIAGAAIAFTLTDTPFWNRMATMTSQGSLESDPAADLRMRVWRTSLSLIADHPYGVGLGNFPRAIGIYDYSLYKRSAHNTVLSCFVELGVHGGLVFLAMVAGSIFLALRCSRVAHLTDYPLETKLMAYATLVSCVTYFVTGLGTDRFLCESFWWVLALPLCLHRVVVGELRAHADVPALATRPILDDEIAGFEGLQGV